MSVSEQQVAQVVAEFSQGAEDDPRHAASIVGGFMQRQPTIGHYVSSHSKELGLEGVVLTLLHAAVITRCVELVAGRALAPITARDLDAATSAPDELATAEPALIAYMEGNIAVEDPTLGGARRDVALQLLRLITRALLD